MSVQSDLQKLADPKKAVFLGRYFKTGKGEYGEGDVFLGITVPAQRAVAKKYKDLPLSDVETLIHSPIHECRLTGLLILCAKFAKADEALRKKIVDVYLGSTKYINNWDLVDLSSHEIIGTYLVEHPEKRPLLLTLARSKSMWERRIAAISTFAFLKQKDFKDSLSIAEILLRDREDLIHKALGWMLREVGEVNLAAEEEFLKKHGKTMPRTALRYAVEKFPAGKRKFYMS